MPEGTLGLKSRSDVKAHHTIRMTTKVETEALLKNMQHFLPWVELCRHTHLRLPVEGLLVAGADPAFRECLFNPPSVWCLPGLYL
jgi:hypothetical protein